MNGSFRNGMSVYFWVPSSVCSRLAWVIFFSSSLRVMSDMEILPFRDQLYCQKVFRLRPAVATGWGRRQCSTGSRAN